MNEIGEQIEKSVSSIVNPFTKDGIDRVMIVMQKNPFNTGEINFYANVCFKNGNTKGEQKITGTSFDDLIIKLKLEIASL